MFEQLPRTVRRTLRLRSLKLDWEIGERFLPRNVGMTAVQKVAKLFADNLCACWTGLLFRSARHGAFRSGSMFFGFHITILGARHRAVNAGANTKIGNELLAQKDERGG